MPFSGNTTDYSPYMRLYNASAHAVKDVHSSLKVGGPSSNGKVCCIETFIDVANNMSAPFDFVSGSVAKFNDFCRKSMKPYDNSISIMILCCIKILISCLLIVGVPQKSLHVKASAELMWL